MRLPFLAAIITIFFSFGVMAHVPRDGKVTGAFGLLMASPTKKLKINSIGSSILGLDLQVIGDIDDRSSLQIELGVIPHQYSIEEGANRIEEQVNTAQIDLGYRRWLAPYISSTLVISSIYGVGDIERSVHTESSTQTSAHSYRSYGLKCGVQLELGDAEFNNPTLDIRYFLPFSPKPNEQMSAFSVFLGYRFEVR